jgi:peptide/nickel transport system permease protein
VTTHEHTPEVLGTGAGLGAAVAVESGPELGEPVEQVRARGYWEQVWRRFRRDRVAFMGGGFIILLVLMAWIGGPIAAHILGHGPNDQLPGGVDQDPNSPTFLRPVGPLSHVSLIPYVGASGHFGSTFYVLGGADSLGRDEFLRLLYGAQVSLEVAIGATLLSMTIGVTMGALAGFYGRWIDTLVSRVTEIVMAFPVLLFIIALASTIGDRLNGVTFGGVIGEGVFTLVLVLGLFGWYYPARIVRAQILSLREKEFVEAARMIGATDGRIIRSHLLPHLVAPIIVYSTLIVAQNILLETGLSYLGVGIKLPTASWGNLLQTGSEYYLAQPWLMVWPGMVVLLTTLSFNLLGDGLRDAFDPRAAH